VSACADSAPVRDLLADAWERWARRCDELTDDQWSSPTRFTRWTVRALVAHVCPLLIRIPDSSAVVEVLAGAPLARSSPPSIIADYRISKRPLDCESGLVMGVVGAARPLPLVPRLFGISESSRLHPPHVAVTDGFQTYHVMNPYDDGIGLDEFVDWLIAAGHPILRVGDYAGWLARFETAIRALPERQRQASLLPLLHNYRRPETPIRGSIAPTDRFRAAVQNAKSVATKTFPM
jgi:hypothetical protein